MFSVERREKILQLVNEKSRVTVSELAAFFFVGEASIRRDLDKLARGGLLRRTHGGAVRLETGNFEIPLTVREAELLSDKTRIARAACHLLADGSAIVMDSSSTVLKMIPSIQAELSLTILTNGARTACELSTLPNAIVYSTGGVLRHQSLSYTGSASLRAVESFVADALFFSCRAVSLQHGLLEIDENECELRKAMIKNSRKRILLCDHTKFETTSIHRICPWDDVDVLITNRPLSEAWGDCLQAHGVQLIVA